MKSILVTGVFRLTDQEINNLADLGFQVIEHPDEREPFCGETSDIVGIICNRFFDANNINNFPKLKLIQLTSSGIDQLSQDIISKDGLKIENARGVYSIPIAEWAVGKILEIAKQSRLFYSQQNQHEWIKCRDIIEIQGKTAVIVGFGDIGHEIAARLRAFGVRVIGVGRRSSTDHRGLIDDYVIIEKIDEVLPSSDITIICLPLSDNTRQFFNEERLKLCKTGSIFVNISRGAIVDENALSKLISAGHFRGVALDVFADEPLPSENQLWDLQQVLITPHNSFVSNGNRERLYKKILENFKQWITTD